MDDGVLHSWLGRLLQVGDSAFPTGGYAHSYGFEQVTQFGVVKDEATLASYLNRHVWPMLTYLEMPVVRFARKAALENDQSELMELDACIDATKTARESREASRAMGRRRMDALDATGASEALTCFRRAVEEGKAQGHHAVVYGIGLAALPTTALLTSWAFQSLSAICQASPKLIRIGQDAVQRALTLALADMETQVDRSLAITRDELGWFDPLVEIASMQHEIAYERLFIS
jgi:urease accessory protein